MSKTNVMRQKEIIVCDWCDKEVHSVDEKAWAELNTRYISQPMSRAKRLIFRMDRRQVFGTIRYDFHAECFEPMMDAVAKLKHKDGGGE